jgi:hypothetical protein
MPLGIPSPPEFDKRPPIRCILLDSTLISDLIILCHHMIRGVILLAYQVNEILQFLGDSSRECEIFPDPPLLTRENLPRKILGDLLA